MYPDQSPAPKPENNYDFILNPKQPQKRGLFGKLNGDPFITKIAFIVGGAVILMVVLALVVNFFFGSKSNTDSIVSVAQNEQEIVRLSALGKDASSQQIKNAAINTAVSIKSQQNEWLAFLNKHNREVKLDELNFEKDDSTDKRLKNAEQTSTFDVTYSTVMRSMLETYATSLKTVYDASSNQQERSILNDHYNEAQLLLEQWSST